MKKSLLLLLVLITLYTAHAQKNLQDRKSFVTLSLGSMVSFAPRFNAGYIHQVSDRWWAGTALGYNAGLYENDYGTPQYRLFEARPELYFDLRPDTRLKHLASFELFYINHTDHFKNGEYTAKADGVEYEYDSADYKRVKTGFNINYNLIYYITPQLVLWQKIGLGLRNRKVTYTNIVNKTESDQWNLFDFGDRQFIQKEGPDWNANFNLDLSLAYRF